MTGVSKLFLQCLIVNILDIISHTVWVVTSQVWHRSFVPIELYSKKEVAD